MPPKVPDAFVAVYLRKSTTDRQEHSIPDQLAEIVKAIRVAHPERRITTILADEESGKNQGRTGYQKLLELTKSPARPFSRIYVWRLNRFSRAEPLLALRDLIDIVHSGVEIVAVADKLEVNSENFNQLQGLLPIVLQTSESHNFLIKLSQDTSRGQRSHLAHKFRQGSQAPYGFRRAVVNGEGQFIPGPDGKKPWVLAHGERPMLRSQHARLVPGPQHEVEIVRRIFQMRAIDGKALRVIALQLNREFGASGFDERLAPPSYPLLKESGKLSKSASAFSWTMTSLYWVVRNPAYVGRLVWGRVARSNSLRMSWDKQARKSTAKYYTPDSWVVIEDAHEPLVPLTWFERATDGRRLGEGHKGSMGKASRHLLVGKGQCASCGSPIWATKKQIFRHVKDGPVKKRVFVYLYCSGRDRGVDTKCQPFLVNHRHAMNFLIRTVIRQRKLLPDKRKMLSILRERISARISRGKEVHERRSAEVVQVEGEIARLLDQVGKGLLSMSDPFVQKNYKALKERHETLKNTPPTAVTKEELEKLTENYLKKAVELFEAFETSFRKAPVELQRAYLWQILDRYEVHPVERKVMFFLRDLPLVGGGGEGAEPVADLGISGKPMVWEPDGQGARFGSQENQEPRPS